MNILIVDDHRIFREGLERMLRINEEVKNVYQAENGIEALLKMELHQPDIVFMDIQMKEMNGMNATLEACKKFPAIKIIALSQCEDKYHVLKMFENGAKGFLIKTSAGIDEIHEAIKMVSAGEKYYAPEVIEVVNEQAEKKESWLNENLLSKREMEILISICEGKKAKKIADELFLSIRTVDWHRKNILSKTNTNSIAELINLAINQGLYLP
jgi:DNA-binding NarL/FixJ family response regulator